MQLPLEGRVVVGWGGDDVSTNYHAYYPAQRWAYDLMHEPFFTESDRLEDYGCYGKTIVSPVTGKVVFVKDGLIDQIPAKLPEGPVFPLGNSVGIALDEDEDIVVFMAHMMKGSVRVQEGQAIRAGRPLGDVGTLEIHPSRMYTFMPKKIEPIGSRVDRTGRHPRSDFLLSKRWYTYAKGRRASRDCRGRPHAWCRNPMRSRSNRASLGPSASMMATTTRMC